MRKISIILLVIGIFLFLSYFLYYGYKNKEEKENIELYIESTSVVEVEEQEEIIVEEVKEEKQDSTFWVDYKAILEIPKINLKKGMVESTKNFSSINYAISIDKSSNYPDEEGNFILYAHSGNSKIAYFRNLNKLNVNDEVFVYYEGVKYSYQIINKYEIEKTGKMEVIRDSKRKLITMVTCISNTNKQVVLIGEQIEEVIY